MTVPVTLAFARIRPAPEDVLASQGIPPGVEPGARILDLYRRAVGWLEEDAAPRGLVRAVSPEEFAGVFRGADENAPEAPLAGIFPLASRLALFAVTLGPAVTARITRLFADGDYPLGAMLDSAASEAVERAGDALAERFRHASPDADGPAPVPGGGGPNGGAPDGGAAPVSGDATPDAGQAILRYSPGYCGWHLSGQRALFAALEPERIGITLRPSFLMEPLKSMTGVIVTGPAEIHRFEPDFPFCAECVSHSCRRRMREAADHRS